MRYCSMWWGCVYRTLPGMRVRMVASIESQSWLASPGNVSLVQNSVNRGEGALHCSDNHRHLDTIKVHLHDAITIELVATWTSEWCITGVEYIVHSALGDIERGA